MCSPDHFKIPLRVVARTIRHSRYIPIPNEPSTSYYWSILTVFRTDVAYGYPLERLVRLLVPNLQYKGLWPVAGKLGRVVLLWQ
jgi:hypothetical protein